MRLASRTDTADGETKGRLRSLGDTVMSIMQAMVKMTEHQLEDASDIMTEILATAADENGEWYLPLASGKLQALKTVLLLSFSRINFQKGFEEKRGSIGRSFSF